MKVYITSTYKGEENKVEIENICSLVRQSGFEDFSFIRDIESYQKTFTDTKELMNRAKEEILKCDALLLDVTQKSTGRTIEAGIAFANGKKIIIIAKRGACIKDTLKGVADVVIEYDTLEDIVEPLTSFYSQLSAV